MTVERLPPAYAGRGEEGIVSNESWRPKLHLAPQNGSISDPNGLCQFRGTYHVCCQNAPEYPGNFDSPQAGGTL